MYNSNDMEENNLKGLDRSGFRDGTMKFDPSVFENLDKIEKIRTEIRKYFTKTTRKNPKNTSYGLKHIMERHIGEYVSNGEFIYSMHLEGFKIFKENINCGFNVSKTGINLLANANKIKEILGTPLDYEYSVYLKKKELYLKYKYHLKLFIDTTFWNKQIKPFVPAIIGKEIDVSAETIEFWINLLKSEEAEIPSDKLKLISNLLNQNDIKLINTESF